MSDTPRADALEKTRISLGGARTPAYGDALALVRQLEIENARLRLLLEQLEDAHSDERDELWCRPIHAAALSAVRGDEKGEAE